MEDVNFSTESKDLIKFQKHNSKSVPTALFDENNKKKIKNGFLSQHNSVCQDRILFLLI